MRATPEEVLDFWIELGPKKWWKRSDAVDSKIREHFEETHRDAAKGKLDHWLNKPDSALALIILLDQFSRNLNRNSPAAFAEDTRCTHLVNHTDQNRFSCKVDFIEVLNYHSLCKRSYK